MARKIRIEYPGALYHVIARGNRREAVFLNNSDYEDYLSRLRLYKERFGFVTYAYCLMPNHVHLLIEAGEVPLSKIMHCLQFSYTQSFNRRHKKVGHLFQGRYKAILCNKDSYLLELVRYIHLNPVRTGMVKSAKKYRWSSHREYLGSKELEHIVDVKLVLGFFGRGMASASTAYRRFIQDGMGDGHREEFYQIKDQRILGDEEFAEKIVSRYEGLQEGFWDLELDEIAECACKGFDISLSSLAVVSRQRRTAIVRGVIAFLAKKLCGATLVDVGRYLKRRNRAMSHVLHVVEEKMKNDLEFAKFVKGLEQSLTRNRRPILVRKKKRERNMNT